MELKKIDPTSAVYFGVASFVMYFIVGLIQIILVAKVPEVQSTLGYTTSLQALITGPIVGALAFYVVTLLVIAVYNFVAKKYPISWEVKHK